MSRYRVSCTSTPDQVRVLEAAGPAEALHVVQHAALRRILATLGISQPLAPELWVGWFSKAWNKNGWLAEEVS